MKLLFLSLALSALYACQRDELPAAGVKFEKGSDIAGTPAEKDWHYAKYRFTLAGTEDVLVAVRVAVNDDNEATHLEVKDLTEGRENREVEKATLAGTMNDDGNYDFRGTSVLTEGDTDFGGKYSGTLTVTNGSVADDGCCGEMKFTSTEQGTLTFTGTRMEDFSADDWTWEEAGTGAEPAATPAECEDYKLVFSGLKNVRRGEEFDFTVTALTCDDSPTSNFNGNEVTLHFKVDETEWKESTKTGKELDDPSTRTYKNHRFAVNDNSKVRYQFRASVAHDHDDDENTNNIPYTAESDVFELNPITAVDDGSCAGTYSLEVSEQPVNTAVGVDYTFEVTLKCDGTTVSDIAEDKAASAPITKVQFKKGSTGSWVDSSMIKDKEVAGALDGGKKTFTSNFDGRVASLQYKIGVTINGKTYEIDTNKFDITE